MKIRLRERSSLKHRKSRQASLTSNLKNGLMPQGKQKKTNHLKMTRQSRPKNSLNQKMSLRTSASSPLIAMSSLLRQEKTNSPRRRR